MFHLRLFNTFFITKSNILEKSPSSLLILSMLIILKLNHKVKLILVSRLLWATMKHRCKILNTFRTMKFPTLKRKEIKSQTGDIPRLTCIVSWSFLSQVRADIAKKTIFIQSITINSLRNTTRNSQPQEENGSMQQTLQMKESKKMQIPPNN